MKGIAFAAALVASLALMAPAWGQAQHVRGEVVAATGDDITVKQRDGGSVTLTLTGDSRVSGLAPAKLEDIKAGAYIGTTSVPQRDGSLVALHVHFFPEQMRGVAEGHSPWDLKPESTMTNATVAQVSEDPKGRMVKVSYKDGEKTVLVPPETPIVAIAPAGRDKLVPGAQVFAVARKAPDGKMNVVRLSIGLDGVVPPM